MTVLEEQLLNVEDVKCRLEEMAKPLQQDLNQRRKKFEFIKKIAQCVDKNDFFQLDGLLKSKLAGELMEDPAFEGCDCVFAQLQMDVDKQIQRYQAEFRSGLMQAAEQAGLPVQVDLPKFFMLKGIKGEVDFAARRTVINGLTIKSFDPKRIVSAALNLKKKLYAPSFEPQAFIDALFACYQEILKKEKQGIGASVSICQLYTDYVWTLQSKAFLHNMDKAKFTGYSLEQFAVDLWRFYGSGISEAGGHLLRLAPGRIKSIMLIEHTGEERLISHASFVKG